MNSRSETVLRPFCTLIAGFFAIVTWVSALPNVQTFFIPFPEADFQTSLKAIDITGTPVGNSMKTIISVVIPTPGTIIRYDEWEDGYEADLNAPTQATTKIWGDGNLSNGVAPGYPSDILPAGATINLNNNVALPRAAGTLFYDGRDRVGSTAAIAITRAGWGVAPGTVLASATEVYDTRRYGTSYKIPIGITTGSVQNFEYSSLHIIASSDNTSVQVDVDGNGTIDQTKVINLGESMLVNGGVKAGATVTSDKPVQVHELTGDVGSTYESRTFAIRPTSLWGASYFAPVGTTLSTEVHTVFLYNPNISAITVTYETTTGVGTISVPANGNSQFAMPMNSGAHFFTAGGQAFYAVGANDSGAAASANQTHDWGYALVPETYLTTGLVIGFGPGSDDLVAPTGPDQNGNPVWVTPAASTTIYVNYSGDFTIGALTAPNGAKYDVLYAVNKLKSQTIYDPNDKDMTKARIFTTDGVKIAAAWGEDPSKAGPGAPYLDMGTTIVPFPQPSLSKTSSLAVDLNSNGQTDVGDTIEYTVRVSNEGVVDLDNTVVLDALPNTCTYVSGSTKVNGLIISDNAAPSTIFPVDESGYTLVSIPPGGFTLVKYRVTVNPGATSVINHVTANGGSVSAPLSATTTVPIAPPGGTAPTTIIFSDSVGTSTALYPPNGNVYVTVTNVDLNTNSAVVETINVTVTNPTTGDQELITLTETGPATGIFRNTTPLPSSLTSGLTQQDGTLYALEGNGLVATFVNTLFGGTFTANAAITTTTQTKKLYLTDALALDRVNPAAAPLDLTTASTSAMGLGASTISVLGATSSAASTAEVGSLTFSHTVANGSDRILVVSASMGQTGGIGAEAISTVTFGGVGLTKSVGYTDVSGAKARTEIWYLINPSVSTANVVISLGASQTLNITAGATTFSGADQSAPVRASNFAGGSGTAASVGVTSAAGDLVYASLDADDRTAAQITEAVGQTLLWESQSPTGTSQTGGSATTKAGSAGTVTNSWTITSDIWAAAAISIKPSTGGSSSVSFTQSTTFATAFTMPAGVVPSASVYYTVASGSMPASPSITAVLKNGATTIATSSSASASGGLLTFTFPALSSVANFAIGDAVTLQITTAQSGVTFTVDYDSSTKPSVVNLPTTTVIVINSFGLYDAAYPGGSLVTTMTNGQRVYARAVASDPFGAYDITSLDLTITDPSAGTSAVNLTTAVDSTASTKTYEYSWVSGPSDGGYTIQAKANEGTEGINVISTVPLQVMSLDLGTPSTTTFTDASGNTVTTYTTTGPVYVQVVDRDQNTNPAVAETVTAVVTSSNGDRMTVTLTETGPNTGIFRGGPITTSVSTVIQNDSTLNIIAGATLAANYVDPTDPSDTSSAAAQIPSGSTSSVNIVKSLVSPASGKALVGDTITYSLTVTNTGTGSLAVVNVLDTYPTASLQYLNTSLVSPAPVQSTSGSNTIQTWSLGGLAVGQSISFNVNFKALAAGAAISNSASVTGTVTAGPSTVSVNVEKPGITVTKTLLTPAAGPVYIGDTVVWHIVVQNSGSTILTTVPLSDNYSGGALTYVSATIAPNSVGAGSLLWNNIGPINVAAAKTIDVTMTVKGTSNPTTNIADVSYAVDASGNSVSPSVSSASVQTIGGSIGNTIFKDMNNNGIFDNGEGVQNVYVYSDTNGNGVRDVGEPFGITDYYGAYSIYNLPVGISGTTYNIKVDTTTLPAGLTTVVVDPDVTKNGQTSITLTRAALDNTAANFGYRGTASVSDTVWLDVNGDGLLDVTDRGISGVKVFIDQNNNGTADANEPFAITDSNGNYLISNLPDATWSVAIDVTTLPAGVSPTYDLNGTATPHKTSVVLTPGQARTDVDFGYIGGASIGSTIYNDLNGDGTQAATDLGLAGIKVFVDLNGDGVRQANEQFVTTDASGTYLISGLTAGTYAVVVDTTSLPAGVTIKGDPDVSKDGKTTVTLTSAQALTTANFGYQGNASVGDRVWNDLNGNGVQDTTEPSISGVQMFIDLNANGTREANEPFATTDSSGNYTISGLAAGSYTVAVDTTTLPAGVTQTGDPDASQDNKTAVTLAAGQSLTTADFGYQGNASVGDYVWNDANGNGLQDATEPPISGVGIFIDLNANNSRDANEPFATTNASGAYMFTGLIPGTYTVAVDTTTLPSGTTNTGDPDVTKDGKTSVTLAAGSSNTTTDFGYQGNGAISATVFLDRDASGAQTSGEPGISGVNVFLDYNSDGIRQSNEPLTTTSSTGAYSFTGLIPGNYSVVVVSAALPTGVTQTADADATKDNQTTVTVTAGTTNTTPIFGYQGNASVGDYVWIDNNGDGLQGPMEIPLSGVTLYLDLNGNGTRESNEPFATTNASGVYTINGLIPGAYTVDVDGSTLPTGSTNTGDPDATKDGKTSVTLAAAQSLTTADFGYQGIGAIGSTIYNDLNGDGIQSASDLPLAGVMVFMDLNNDGILQVNEPVATTDSSGTYAFTGLPAGTYHIAVDARTLPPGVTNTGDPDVTKNGKTDVVLTAGETNTTTNFGYQGNASIGTTIWLDQNGDGIKSGSEPGIAGVTVFIDRNGNGTRDANEPFATTNASGTYTISGLAPAIYQVVVDSTTLPTGLNNTGDPDSAKDGKTSVTLVAAQNLTTVNFGYQGDALTSGHLYIDTNGNGTQDVGEPNLADVDVLITDSLGNTQTVTTNATGDWTANVPPGTTIANVQEGDPDYPTGSTRTQGTDPTTFTAASGTTTNGGTDGYFLPGSIGGSVLAETNLGVVPLAGVVIHILDEFGAPVLDGLGAPVIAMTLADGSYNFGNLPPGIYCVHQDQPSGFGSVSDTDGANNNSIGDEHPIVVSAGNHSGGNDFMEIELGTISGHVLLDTDNNGSGDGVLPGVVLNLLDSSGLSVLDGNGAPIQVASAAGGYYSFSLVYPGSYRVSQNQPAGYGSVSDVDGANNNLIGDETPILVTPGLVVTNRDFVEIALGSITGTVLEDTDNNGSGDAPLASVVLTLLDVSGNPVDSNPGLPGIQPLTATTDIDGNYSFGNLFPGNYQVSQAQPSGYGSVSDADGGDLNLIGNVVVLTVAPGQAVTGRDFVEIQLGAISGYVTTNGNPLANVTLTLLDNSGNPVDGDEDTPGIQPVTTVTDSSGFYTFSGVMPGSYQVAQTQPFGYNSDSDKDGGNLDIVGDITRIVLLPGQTNTGNDFTEVLDTCPDNWDEWKFQHPGEVADGNPDADTYDNLAEFAFALPYDSGVGNAWVVQPSVLAPGTLEGVFIRPKGATQNVIYTLQYAAALGNPTIWQSLVIDSSNSTAVGNLDCTETVTIHGLESLTNLTGGNGMVRIKAELDEIPPTGTDHTSYTEVEGWKETGLELCCRTYSNPFLRETAFTGIVTGVNGQTLDLAGSAGGADLGDVITGGSYYVEVTSGDNEGQRFDVVSGSVNGLTLATDSNLLENAAPFNTATGALPANLAGDAIVLRRHWTLAELFPPASFGGSLDPAVADQVQLYADGSWTFYWLFSDGISAPHWVKTNDNTYGDQGASVIPPGQGLFFNNRTSITSVLAYGEVRPNNFVRPLGLGNNLAAGGYPIDQSASGTAGRQMMVSQGYFGSRDLATADTFYVWKGDSIAGATGYDSYFLNDNAPRLPSVIKWVKVGDAGLINRNAENLLLGNRSVFIRSKNGIPGYTTPSPWAP